MIVCDLKKLVVKTLIELAVLLNLRGTWVDSTWRRSIKRFDGGSRVVPIAYTKPSVLPNGKSFGYVPNDTWHILQNSDNGSPKRIGEPEQDILPSNASPVIWSVVPLGPNVGSVTGNTYSLECIELAVSGLRVAISILSKLPKLPKWKSDMCISSISPILPAWTSVHWNPPWSLLYNWDCPVIGDCESPLNTPWVEFDVNV